MTWVPLYWIIKNKTTFLFSSSGIPVTDAQQITGCTMQLSLYGYYLTLSNTNIYPEYSILWSEKFNKPVTKALDLEEQHVSV
jgi:hypothetical protein